MSESTLFTNMVGNPIDGFKCYGIFDNFQAASDWQDGCDESCWIVELETQEDLQAEKIIKKRLDKQR